MSKTILITGSTDGIGLAAARMLASQGHRVLLHGRNPGKLEKARDSLPQPSDSARVEGYVADLSRLADVEALADAITKAHAKLDVLINNAGIFKTAETRTAQGLDVRFAVNTLAPYLLTRKLLPLLGGSARVINLSSAAQSPVDIDALAGRVKLSDDFSAYAQSKLALTMWSRELSLSLGPDGPTIIAVNPGSMLGTKMVQEGFGVAGGDVRIGAEILVRAALDEAFAAASGRYFDNDQGRFAQPHRHALDSRKSQELLQTMDVLLGEATQSAG